MGSPQFAVPIVSALYDRTDLAVVLTQPDKPSGRGKQVVPSEVKRFAAAHEIPVLEPRRLRKEPEVVQALQAIKPDVFVVAAYGQILPAAVLNIPRWGCVNVHASLLPRWRGASPIQAAIIHGDAETGVTIMKMDEGMDTGPILKTRKIPIAYDDTGESLSIKLSELGRDLLMDVLPQYLTGEIDPILQKDDSATYAPLIKKEDGLLDPDETAFQLERKVRAYYPWPGTFIKWNETILKIMDVEVLTDVSLKAGERGIIEKYPVLGTAAGAIKLLQVQMPGKNSISGKDFLNGARYWLDQ